MNRIKCFALIGLLVTSLSFAQNKEITLKEIWNGTFRTERMDALHSMKNGKQYSVLNYDRSTGNSTIDIYDYKTLSKVKTLLSSADIDELQGFFDYTFSDDETKVILTTKEVPVFRRSRLGTYYVYDTVNKTLDKISAELIQEPTLSPDGSKVAYGFENNLYIKDLSSGSVIQITSDGEKNKIINGITDWVYEE